MTPLDLLRDAAADYARRYSELGWALIRTNGKKPRDDAWQQTKPLEPGFAAGLWNGWNGRYNIGVVLGPSRLLVFEYDDEGARERFFDLLGGELPRTPICRTGSGKLHVYFADSGGLKKTSHEGLELRLGGHQCLVPPSVHPDTGEPYEWIHAPWEVTPLPLPDEITTFFAGSRVNGRKRIPATIPPGERHDSFVSVAATMRASGLGEAAILAALRGLNAEQTGGLPKRDEELVAIARDSMGWDVGKPRKTPTYTDLGNAERFAAAHAHRLRHVKEHRHWLRWQGGRWRVDVTGEAERAAKDTAREMLRMATEVEDPDRREKAVKYALSVHSDARIRAMLSLASTEPDVVLAAEELDRDPFLLSASNGTIDLRSGQLRNPDPTDLLSLGTDVAYDPAATCPRWDSFLEEVFDGDRDLIGYVRRLAGYSLTGDTREQVVAVLHGSGGNGKDTMLKPIQRIAGEHAVTASMDTFTKTRDKGVRNDLARLYRARLVVASESAEGRRLDEPTIKAISGGNKIAARFLYAEHFEFIPGFTVWLVTNHRPRVEGDDDAIWRRLRLIPFTVSFVGREDRELDDKLEAELPGILTWAVEGCLEWQASGLGACPAVEEATRDYRTDEDVLGTFIAEQCELEGEVEATTLRAAYDEFCQSIGEKPLSANVLGKRLARRGIRKAKRRNTYVGIRLR